MATYGLTLVMKLEAGGDSVDLLSAWRVEMRTSEGRRLQRGGEKVWDEWSGGSLPVVNARLCFVEGEGRIEVYM